MNTSLTRFTLGLCFSLPVFVGLNALPGCAAFRGRPAPVAVEPAAAGSQSGSILAGAAGVAQRDEWEAFVATAYCSCTKCCGRNAQGITAAGYRLRPGSRVVAVDPTVIPLRSRIEIAGSGEFAALDTGSAIKGKRIDIWIPSHRDALQFGRRTIQVRVGERLSRAEIERVASGESAAPSVATGG
jgi:3D (Asp-Asp-Asp) domain-containing protein